MLPYLAVFAFTTLLLIASESVRIERRVDLYLQRILVALALIAPCVLAGARDIGVGTDTAGYGIWLYELAADSDGFLSYINAALGDSWHMEFLFAAQAYLVVKVFSDIFWYYFFIELAMIVPVYCVARLYCNGKNTWIVILVYLLVFYCAGLNAMRQYIAMSFILVSFMFLERGRKGLCVFYFAIAFLYHSSAIVALAVFALWVMCCRRQRDTVVFRESAAITALFCFFAAIVFIMGSRDIIGFMLSIVRPLNKYLYVLSGEGQFYFGYYVLTGALIVWFVVVAQQFKLSKNTVLVFCIAIIALSFVPQSLEVYSQPLQRLAKYFLIFCIPAISICVSHDEKLGHMSLYNFPFIGYGVAFFLFYFVLSGSSDVIPYTSALLGFSG